MNARKKNAARRRAAARRGKRDTQPVPRPAGSAARADGAARQRQARRLSRKVKVFSSNPLITALVAAVVTCAGTWVVTREFDAQNQAAANAATIQADRSEQAAERAERQQAVRAEAEDVTYGISPVPGAQHSEPELIVENRSNGWIRDIMLYIPMPNSSSVDIGNAAGVSWAAYGIGPDPIGQWFAMELPDILVHSARAWAVSRGQTTQKWRQSLGDVWSRNLSMGLR